MCSISQGVDDRQTDEQQISYIISTALGIYCSLLGIGSRDSGLEAEYQAESFKYFTIWILVYILALAIIISSIR